MLAYFPAVSLQPPKKQPQKGGKTSGKTQAGSKKAKPAGSGGKAKKKVGSVQLRKRLKMTGVIIRALSKTASNKR